MPIATGHTFGGSFKTDPLWVIANKLRKNLSRRGLLKRKGTQLYKLCEQMDGWIMLEQAKELHGLMDKVTEAHVGGMFIPPCNKCEGKPYPGPLCNKHYVEHVNKGGANANSKNNYKP